MDNDLAASFLGYLLIGMDTWKEFNPILGLFTQWNGYVTKIWHQFRIIWSLKWIHDNNLAVSCSGYVLIGMNNWHEFNLIFGLFADWNGYQTQGLSQNNVDHCEDGHKTPSIVDVKHSVM